MTKNCLICKKEFKTKPSVIKKGNGRFCSRLCYEKWYSENKHPRGKTIKIKCDYCEKEKKIFQCRKRKRNFCNNRCFSQWLGNYLKGENNPTKRKNVRDKISKGRKKYFDKVGRKDRKGRRMYDLEYIKWRLSVFTRDSWICRRCENKGGHLHPHHIQNYSQYPELRYYLDNGITFCEKCHKLFHKIYGNRNNNEKQIMEFLYERNQQCGHMLEKNSHPLKKVIHT